MNFAAISSVSTCRSAPSTTSSTMPSTGPVPTTTPRISPTWTSPASTRSSKTANPFWSAPISVPPTVSYSALKISATATPGPSACSNVKIAVSLPRPPSPISASAFAPAKSAPCPTCRVAAMSFMPSKNSRRSSLSWKIGPTTRLPFWTNSNARRLSCKQARRDQQGRLQALRHKVAAAANEQAKAIPLADEVAVLTRWLRADVFAVTSLPYADRTALFDFIVAELQTRIPLCPHRLGPVCTLLQNHRDELLAFALQLEQDLTDLATEFEVPVDSVRRSEEHTSELQSLR